MANKRITTYRSLGNEWRTPYRVYRELDHEFHFTLDAAATADNSLCDRFFTIHDDGLSQKWEDEVVWLNPPYSEIEKWVHKAYTESEGGAVVVCLLPASTGTRWFHRFVLGRAAEIRFLQGRLRFGNADTDAPFDSIVVVYGRHLPK